MAAGKSVDLACWQEQFEDLVIRIGGRFKRVEPRRLAGDLLRGMVSDLAVKNCWTIAEHAGHKSPDRLQHLLRAAVWDEDGIVGDLRGYAVEHLGEEDVVLIVDETGDLKKGTGTVGVQRQYTGTAGRIENAQVAVYLTYATRLGHTMIDRALYLPKSWAEDPDRCADAGVPDGTKFATKPALAGELIGRALDGGVKTGWVAGDEVYGADGKLRRALEARGVGYVLAVACDHQAVTNIYKRTSPRGKTCLVVEKKRADELAAGLPKRAWQQLSAGAGSKGERVYDWAWVTIASESANPTKTAPIETRPGYWWLLVRRNRTTGELAFYRCFSPRRVPLSTLVRVAGRRWRIEESFQSGKNLTGLDQHQVRRWNSWHRWTLIAMLAHAFLAVVATVERRQARSADETGIIALTCNEIHRLFNTLLARPLNVAHRLAWSRWRRQHQYRARLSHYARRGHTPPP